MPGERKDGGGRNFKHPKSSVTGKMDRTGVRHQGALGDLGCFGQVLGPAWRGGLFFGGVPALLFQKGRLPGKERGGNGVPWGRSGRKVPCHQKTC